MPELDKTMTDKLGLILKNWKERLIDVSKSNPLLGLNRSRAAKLEVVSPDLSAIVKTLTEDEGIIKLPFVQKKTKKTLQIFDGEEQQKEEAEEYILQKGDIDFHYSDLGDLKRKTRKIFDNSRLTLTERGVNTLHLVIGGLEWEDSLIGKSESPLIMIPCEFEYKGPSRALGLKMTDGDIILNPALQYYLRERQEVDLEDLTDDFSSEKIDSVLQKIQEKVKLNGWVISKKVWLGIFSFETLAIYQDLKLLDAQARSNKLVHALAHLGGETIENLALDSDLDSLETPKQVPVPVVESDSSQLRALTLATQGANLVIHGPPGTGKSQTITAIIAQALGQKKKVLFVSAKMAALNVVHTRLQKLNLGQYCLEAHGVKSGKKKVVDELKRTLETNEDIKVAKNIEEDLTRLIENRAKLNDYVRFLHDANNPLELSLFNAYGKYEKLSSVELIKAPLPTKWQELREVSRRELESALDVLREVSSHSDLFLQKDSHPLKGMKLGAVDLVTLERIEDDLKKLSSFCTNILKAIENVSRFFPRIDIHMPDLFSSASFFGSLATITELPSGWHKKTLSEYESILREISECLVQLGEKKEYQQHLLSFTTKSPKEIINVHELFSKAYPSWYHKINLKYLKDRKICLNFADKVPKPTISLIESLVEKSEKLEGLDKVLAPRILKFGFSNSQQTLQVSDGLKRIEHEYEIAKVIRIWVDETKIELAENPKFDENESNSFAKIVDIINLEKESVGKILKNVSHFWPNGISNKVKLESVKTSEIVKISTELMENLNQSNARDWQTICRLVERSENSDLHAFLKSLEREQITRAPEILEKRFYSLWIDASIHSKPVLSEFSESSQKELIFRFKELDEKIRKLMLINIIAEPAKIARQVKLAHSGFGNANGVGILRKEMEKKKKLKPLRVLFNEIPQVLQALKPCFLMSPLSVSTFLKPGAFFFDLVIFDEASQLPTPEAIPSILRAKQVVVAGDSKQLPPTAFFRSSMINDSGEWEEGEIDELESLLDDCKASVPVFQETDLKWHYRSRDERLISFSNHYYYENRLITFPTPQIGSGNSGVVLEYITDGIWDRGGSRINRKEARRVATLIIEHLKVSPGNSLGVVALNSSQKEAIEEALEEELLNCKELMPFLDPEKEEPFFIKSLENVQGDERDVIIISVGYGKAQDGKMTLNFGPINTEGGWRRLNVLVTRAKWKTLLVTSIRSSELSGINPENRGAMGLKNYIQYAETGFLNESKEAPRVLQEETNDFEDTVRKELELRGFKVDAQVGVGSFKIDLAVRSPDNGTGYSIGIECDGATYHSSRSARDRDILRQEILEAMGWKIYRIWSTAWFRNRDESVKSLIESVNRATNGAEISQPHTSVAKEIDKYEENLVTVPPRRKAGGSPYKKSTARCNREIIMKPNKINPFVMFLVSIVSDEGPIHVDLLMERVKELAKVDRAGANIQSNFDAALKMAIKEGYLEKNKEDKGFIYEGKKEYSGFRVEGDEPVRRLYQISAVEIRGAVIYLIQEQFGLAYDNLIQSIKPLFGISRADPEESDRIKDIVDGMIASGSIVRHGPLLNLASKL